jgi:pimeloyl-ACP methyl ester carboxylesterase
LSTASGTLVSRASLTDPAGWADASALTMSQCAGELVREEWDYWIDACQRGVLFLDVLHQRSERYQEHAAKVAPHVLSFGCELLMDGRRLPRPVNYALVRIVPPDGIEIDTRKRPFVIVDPRAGHGPGIGGFKAQSEVGVALKAGHSCYFIGFLPEPVPGQTLEDVAFAEAAFLRHVIELHPQTDGKPAVVGNCQAGWAVMLLAAMRPDLFGPIIIAGSPLSYWAGVRGHNPMRYTGGLLGGSWLTALMSDLGNGRFDGAWLVTNFENLNPANTYWTKNHNLYSKIDTEPPRYLEFEQWWGGHTLLNAAEMQFIVDELFVGNRLAMTEIRARDGTHVDLRNIRSPIVVFCSKGDNITPPQQALDWILDLYESVDDIRAHGQTIVYAIHESIGHLGIFVSASVAKKEHDEFASNIDLIDVLPPGLYQAVMTPKRANEASVDLISGDYLVRFETRTLGDIRALGGNDEEDDRKFATVARVSEINLGLYRTFLQPWVRGWANEAFAKSMREFHPLRLQYEMFSDSNPFMRPLLAYVQRARENRQPVPQDNPFWKTQEQISHWIETSLDAYREVRDHVYEAWFHTVYGSPVLQAMVGLKASDAHVRERPGEDAAYRALVTRRIGELRDAIGKGGPLEALLRALIYVRMPDGVVDERGFNFMRCVRAEAGKGLSLAEFKKLFRDQFFMLLLDEHGAVEAIPDMLAKDPDLASRMAENLHRIIDVVGLRTSEAKARLEKVDDLIEAGKRREKPRPNDRETREHATVRPEREPLSTQSKHH